MTVLLPLRNTSLIPHTVCIDALHVYWMCVHALQISKTWFNKWREREIGGFGRI